MKFQFMVGSRERHRVDFSFSRMWGALKILVDGAPVVRDVRMFSVRLTKGYEFDVGGRERHRVRIEKQRPLLFAGFRKSTYRVFVDGALLETHVG